MIPFKRARRGFEVTVKIGCPVMCDYCPQRLLARAAAHIDERAFSVAALKKVIDNVSQDRHSICVDFAGFTEPFSHKDCMSLIKATNDDRRVEFITLYSTGEGMNPRDIIRLSKIDKLRRRIFFHVRPVGNYEIMKGAKASIWMNIALIARYLPEAEFRFVNASLNKQKLENSKTILRSYGLRFKIERLISRSKNFSIILGNKVKHKKDTNCPVWCKKVKSDKLPVVLPDGRAQVCCNDYGLELTIGNLRKQTWDQLDFQKIIDIQKHPDSGAPCFRDCHYARPI